MGLLYCLGLSCSQMLDTAQSVNLLQLLDVSIATCWSSQILVGSLHNPYPCFSTREERVLWKDERVLNVELRGNSGSVLNCAEILVVC